MMKRERPGTTKTTKAERRKKFDKFKDVAHKCFGPTTSCGMGEGKSAYCFNCKEKITRGTYRNGKWYCDKCERI